MDTSLIREEWLSVLMIIFDLFQILNEKAMEYTDVLNAPLDKVQQDFDQQLLSKNLNVTVCKRYGFFQCFSSHNPRKF